MSLSQKVYNRLPSVIRGFAASVHGYRLSRLRYHDSKTAKMVSEARSRESWEIDQWRKWQKRQLADLLKSASIHVPYYRDYWQGRSDSVDVSDIQNWPILEKDILKEQPDQFVSDAIKRRKLRHTFTSGSTGTPLKIYWTPDTAKAWYALFEARWRNWYGVNRYDRWAIIGGKQVVPFSSRKPPFWVFNRGMRQLYLSAYHLSSETVSAYVEAMEKYKICYIYSYTSAVYSLAQLIKKHKLKPPALKVVITNAEPIYAFQRELIQSVFRCPVRETYGMTEMVVGAGECSKGNLHSWPDAGYLEVDQGDGVLSTYGTGQLVATGFINRDMPLIRYRAGDTVTLEKTGKKCECGIGLPMMRSIEGRNDDLLKTKDGREIGRLDPIFKSDYPIQEAQIVQKELEYCILRIVPLEEYSEFVGEEIADELKSRMGDMRVEVELVDEIPRGANGKFKSVLCEIA